jgi:PEGA domain-containing protein
MRSPRSSSMIVFIALTASACATFSGPTTQRIPVTSVPEGADVSVGSFRGVTPTVIEVSRAQVSYAIRISKEGYKTEVVRLRRIITPAASGENPLAPVSTFQTGGTIAGGAVGGPLSMARGGGVGAVFGMAVVAAELQSGARYRLHPVSIEVTLEPGNPTEVVDSALRELERLKAQGVISEEEYRVLRDRAAEESK